MLNKRTPLTSVFVCFCWINNGASGSSLHSHRVWCLGNFVFATQHRTAEDGRETLGVWIALPPAAKKEKTSLRPTFKVLNRCRERKINTLVVSAMILQTPEHTVPPLTQWTKWKENICFNQPVGGAHCILSFNSVLTSVVKGQINWPDNLTHGTGSWLVRWTEGNTSI